MQQHLILSTSPLCPLQFVTRNFVESRRRRRKSLGGWRPARFEKDRSSVDGEMVPLTGVAVKEDGYQAS